jgi:hypothetical protein
LALSAGRTGVGEGCGAGGRTPAELKLGSGVQNKEGATRPLEGAVEHWAPWQKLGATEPGPVAARGDAGSRGIPYSGTRT